MTAAHAQKAPVPEPRTTKESRIVAVQSEPVRAMLAALKGTRCPNCYETLPQVPALTPTGVAVCDQSCVDGWMGGEKCKETLVIIREMRSFLRVNVTT